MAHVIVFERLYLWVLHDALDAVEVGELTDGLAGVVQQSSDSLCGEGEGLDNRENTQY